MKNIEDITPILFAILIAGALFWGVIIGIKKIMSMPDSRENIEQNAGFDFEKRRLEDVQRQQKQFMQDQKQKIKDLQRL